MFAVWVWRAMPHLFRNLGNSNVLLPEDLPVLPARRQLMAFVICVLRGRRTMIFQFHSRNTGCSGLHGFGQLVQFAPTQSHPLCFKSLLKLVVLRKPSGASICSTISTVVWESTLQVLQCVFAWNWFNLALMMPSTSSQLISIPTAGGTKRVHTTRNWRKRCLGWSRVFRIVLMEDGAKEISPD